LQKRTLSDEKVKLRFVFFKSRIVPFELEELLLKIFVVVEGIE
jgi:hypothetical protein